MHIAFVTTNYPSPSRPAMGTFVQQFVWAMARRGNKCSVVHPISVFDRRHGTLPSRRSTESAGAKENVSIYRPRYVTFSSRSLGVTHTGRWTQGALNRVVTREVQKLPSRPEIIYGHFLYHAGRAAVVAGCAIDVPAVVGVGEGTFWTVDAFGFERAKRHFAAAAGFLAVASHVGEGLVSQLGVPSSRVRVEPNGVDRQRFRPGCQQQARKEIGLAEDLFIVLFVGTFDELKGGARVVAAVDGIEGVSLVMIGTGGLSCESHRIIHKGRVRHEEVANWLRAADVFVLPTVEEGSCNAVIEAMACGLPIVTSNGPHMDDLVDDAVAIRVDAMDVGEIRSAIVELKSDATRRRQMARACVDRAERFDINDRADRVTKWLQDVRTRAL